MFPKKNHHFPNVPIDSISLLQYHIRLAFVFAADVVSFGAFSYNFSSYSYILYAYI